MDVPEPLAGPHPPHVTVLRAMLCARFESRRLPHSPAALVLLGVAALACWLGIDALRRPPQGEFFVYAVVDYAYLVLGALLIIALIHVSAGRRLAFALPCTLVALAAAPLAITWHASRSIDTWAVFLDRPNAMVSIAIAVPCGYVALLWLRGLRELPWTTRLRCWAWGLIGLVGVASSATALGITPNLWVPPPPPANAVDEALWQRASALLFSQPARIDAALRKLPVAQPLAPARVFFVGFAGYGDQRLFAKEIRLAERVVQRRFGSASRSVLLLNDRHDTAAAPLASVSALDYTLQRVAAHMNPDKDVLFLALSSHGGADATLAVVNGPLPFDDLSATELAAALARTPIKWKVIVISACHAGAFIPALKDPYTILLTAAAPDRTSFGCADDRDLSYFGEAFYRDALPYATTLRGAFEHAATAIAARERAEGMTPSLPRAYFGSALAARIDTLLLPQP